MKAVLLALAFLLPAAAQETPREYSGPWQAQSDTSLEMNVEKSGDTVHVTERHAAKVKSEYTCKLGGGECIFQLDGHKAKIALWINGPYLVEMRTKGEAVTKRRLMLKDDKTLQLEVMPVFPQGKKDVILFTRLK